MPARHYITLFRHMRRTKMLRLQVWVLFLTTYIDWVLMPFVTKLEGTHLPVFMISFYMLLGATDGFIQPLFKQVRIHEIYRFVIILDVIQIFSYGLIWGDMVLFTYMILSIFTLQAITFEISRVHTIDFMKEEIELKEYLMLRSMIVSAAIIAGSLSAMALDYFDADLFYTLLVMAVLGIVAIRYEYRLYRRFRSAISESETVIERQKSLMSEKIAL